MKIKFLYLVFIIGIMIAVSCKENKKSTNKDAEVVEEAVEQSGTDKINIPSFPKYDIGDCVTYDEIKGEVIFITDSKLIGTEEYAYRLSLENNEESKLIVESDLNECEEPIAIDNKKYQ